MAEFSDERSNSVVETSLTELAFIFFFILLVVTSWQIKSKSEELLEVVHQREELSSQVANLTESLATAAEYMNIANDIDPNELFIELTAGRKAIQDLKQVDKENQQLERQITALTEAVGSDMPLENVSEALGEHKEMIELLSKQGLTEGEDPLKLINEIVQQSFDAQGQNINLRNKLSKIGNGLDYPPCWADLKTGAIQYVFNVIINEDFVEFKAGWPESRNKQATSDPNIYRVPGKYAKNSEMWTKTKALFDDSVKQNCRHFVRVYDKAESKTAFKNYLLGVENYFYKFLSSRSYI